jgi:hypothetical protein
VVSEEEWEEGCVRRLNKIPAPKILKSFGNDGAKVVNNEGGEAHKLSMEKGPIVCLQLNQIFQS